MWGAGGWKKRKVFHLVTFFPQEHTQQITRRTHNVEKNLEQQQQQLISSKDDN